MTPENHQRAEKPVLEHDITEALRRLEGARVSGDIEAELDAENDMNASLEAHRDLMRAIGGTSVAHSS